MTLPPCKCILMLQMLVCKKKVKLINSVTTRHSDESQQLRKKRLHHLGLQSQKKFSSINPL